MGAIIRPTAWRHDKPGKPTVDEFPTEPRQEDDHRPKLDRSVASEPTPANALTWRTRPQRSNALEGWRFEVGKAFSSNAPALRVAWTLESMFGSRKGYARCTDKNICRKLDLPPTQIRAILFKLEKCGAIVVSHFVHGDKTHRYIWPARMSATGRATRSPHD